MSHKIIVLFSRPIKLWYYLLFIWMKRGSQCTLRDQNGIDTKFETFLWIDKKSTFPHTAASERKLNEKGYRLILRFIKKPEETKQASGKNDDLDDNFQNFCNNEQSCIKNSQVILPSPPCLHWTRLDKKCLKQYSFRFYVAVILQLIFLDDLQHCLQASQTNYYYVESPNR